MEELPVSVALGLEQVRVAAEGDIGESCGGVVFCITVTLAVDLQPVLAIVAVKVYVPALKALAEEEATLKLLGPVHAYVTPEVLELPERVTKLVAQVSVAFDGLGVVVGVAGATALDRTFAVSVAVHPLAVLVTVRVYTPAVLTVGFCVLEVKLFGPVHA